LTARATVRGTLTGAFLVDGEAELNRLRHAADTFVTLYANYERSPRIEFYGLGRDSRKEDRTRYLLNTVMGEVRAGYRFTETSISASNCSARVCTPAPPTARMCPPLSRCSMRRRPRGSSTTPRSWGSADSQGTTRATCREAQGGAAFTASTSIA